MMFNRNIYIKRRNVLSQNLKKGFVLLLGHQNSPMNFSHNTYRFVQDTNFLYYVGVNLPNCACLIDLENNKTIFYMKETTIHDIIWIGKTKSIQSWGDDTGAEEVKDISKLVSDLKNKKNVMYPPQFRAINKIQIHELLGIALNKVEKKSSAKLINAIIKQRSIKSDEEIIEIKNALQITNLIHLKSMTVTNLQSFMQSNLTFTTNTNTVDMGDGFVIEDGDGTEKTMSNAKELKFAEGTGDGASIDINFGSGDGSDGSPFDLSFAVTNTDKGSAQNIFKTVATNPAHSGSLTYAQTRNLEADSNNDTLKLFDGTGIKIEGAAEDDIIRIEDDFKR